MARLGRLIVAFALLLTLTTAPGSVVRATGTSGPIQIGGDDQNDHGSAEWVDHDENVSTPDVVATVEGWKYIMLSLENMIATELRSGASNSIAVLGTDGSNAYVTGEGLTPDDSGASCTTNDVDDTYCAVEVAKEEINRRNGATAAPTVTYYETAAEVDAFLDALAAGTTNVAIIYIPGDGGTNDIGQGAVDDDTVNSDETSNTAMEQALIDGAPTIAAFNAAGGGILASGKDNYLSWLQELLPEISIVDDPTSSEIGMTADGASLWTGLTDTEISSAWHNHFVGSIGSLKVLGLGWDNWTDTDADNMIDSSEATALMWDGPDATPSTADDAQTIVIIGAAAGGTGIGPELPSTNRSNGELAYWLAVGAMLVAGVGLMVRGRKAA